MLMLRYLRFASHALYKHNIEAVIFPGISVKLQEISRSCRHPDKDGVVQCVQYVYVTYDYGCRLNYELRDDGNFRVSYGNLIKKINGGGYANVQQQELKRELRHHNGDKQHIRPDFKQQLSTACKVVPISFNYVHRMVFMYNT